MSLLQLPDEILLDIVNVAVQNTELHRAAQFRQTCRRFDVLVQDSILRLPKEKLLSRKMGQSMVLKLLRVKMARPDADRLLLCYTINLTAHFLASMTKLELQSRYTHILETCATRTLMYWRLLEYITTEESRPIKEEEIMVNAFIAAIAANEAKAVEDLLGQGVSPASNSPFFGEALSAAVLSGSMAMLQMLFDHWDGEGSNHLGGVRIMHAIEAAAAAGRDDMMAKLLEYQDYIEPSTYDEAVVGMVRKNDWVTTTLLLDRRQTHRSRPLATQQFWSNLVRSIAAYDRRDFLQHIIARILPNIQECMLGDAIMDACLSGHSKMVHTLLSHFTTRTLAHHVDGLFWAARCGRLEVLSRILDFLNRDQGAIFVALAGAVSGKKPDMVRHLLSLIGVAMLGQDPPTRFTDIVRLVAPDAFLVPGSPPAGLVMDFALYAEIVTASLGGGLVDVVKLFNTMKAQSPDRSEGHYSFALNWAVTHNQPDVLVFLTENLTSYTANYMVRSLSIAEILNDVGWIADRQVNRFLGWTQHDHLARWMLDNGDEADGSSQTRIILASAATFAGSVSTIKLIVDRSNGMDFGRVLQCLMPRRDDRPEIAELALNSGFPIDVVWSNGADARQEAGTLLYRAAICGKEDLVEYLLSRGADAGIVSSGGRTALEVAERYNRVGVSKILREWSLRSGG